MRTFILLYNSTIWGILVSVIAFQSQWIEMRMNVGILIIPVTIISYLIFYFYENKYKFASMVGARFTYFNILINFVLLFAILGFERIKIVPASIIRELFRITDTSLLHLNVTLLFFLLTGLFIIALNSRSGK